MFCQSKVRTSSSTSEKMSRNSSTPKQVIQRCLPKKPICFWVRRPSFKNPPVFTSPVFPKPRSFSTSLRLKPSHRESWCPHISRLGCSCGSFIQSCIPSVRPVNSKSRRLQMKFAFKKGFIKETTKNTLECMTGTIFIPLLNPPFNCLKSYQNLMAAITIRTS